MGQFRTSQIHVRGGISSPTQTREVLQLGTGSTSGNGCLDMAAPAIAWVDHQYPAHRLYSLPHNSQPEPASADPLPGAVQVESAPIIPDGKCCRAILNSKGNRHARRAGMFERII